MCRGTRCLPCASTEGAFFASVLLWRCRLNLPPCRVFLLSLSSFGGPLCQDSLDAVLQSRAFLLLMFSVSFGGPWAHFACFGGQ